jgi:AraC-like DNA-binding protein
VHDGGIVTNNRGGEFLSIGGCFTLADGQADLFLNNFPPIIPIREEANQATLRWCVERMRHELIDVQPGDIIVAEQLATLVLVEALRHHLSDPRQSRVGWLFALADTRLRAAINSIAEIGAALGYESEKSFSMAFKRFMSCSPRRYGRQQKQAINKTTLRST